MATLTEYSYVCNPPQPLTSSKVVTLESRGASTSIFRQSSTQDMRASLLNGDNVMYLSQNATEFSEEKLLRLLTDGRNRELFDHVHNMRAKAVEPMFCDFISSVRSNLPLHCKPLLAPVNNFHELNKMVSALRKDNGFHKALETASKPFCETYKAEPGFWKQYGELESINTDRNNVVHCSVSVSAVKITEACDSDALDSALAMVEALANYCAKHAADLDASAEEQRTEVLALTERVKQRRKSNLLQK